jgi:chromate reductase, NAD(P)H dehydrogenase (quinone)
MARNRDIAVIVGSLREGSFSRKTARVLANLSPDALKLEIVGIGDLPLYNQDLDPDAVPAQWRIFRDRVRGADGVLFVTPEYNRSVPGALKNAIDVGSRPYGSSVWEKKPGAIVSVTPGALGAFGANHHLRQSCVFLDMPIMAQPEAYLSGAGNFFGEDGRIKDPSLEKLLTRFMAAFADWVELIHRGRDAIASDQHPG